VPVSATSRDGLDRLVAEIARLAAEVPERPADGPLFLPIDRAFSIKGFGTVITGTLLSGQLAEADAAALLPSPQGAAALRVRSVQVHGQTVPRALAGQRTAVNLPGVEPSAIRRGQVLVHPGVVPASSILDVELTLLSAAPKPLAHRGKLLLHVGTTQVAATVALLDRGELPPGGTVLAQLRLAEPVAALPGQRFILRGFAVLEGRGKTVGGGRILGVAAPKRRRGRPEATAQLAALAGGEVEGRIRTVLAMAGPAGLDLPAVVGRTALAPKAAQTALDRLGAKGAVLLFDRERRAYVAGEVAAELGRRLAGAVAAFHRDHPLAAGVGRETLRGALPPITDPRLFQRLLAQAVERGDLVAEGEHVREKGHAAASGAAGGALKEKVAGLLARGGLTPPWLAELPAAAGASAADVGAVLKLLLAEGRVLRATPELWFDAAVVKALEAKLVAFLRERKQISTQEFKELVGATRKHVIPLAEYFDREKVTLRVGERRVLRGEGR
jgi:selenocysteine-specific elongation factor